MKTKYTILSLIIGLLLVAIQSSAHAQREPVDYLKMDRELSLIEKVIETVMSNTIIKSYYSLSSIKGTYLDGYGVVFQVMHNTHNFRGEKAVIAREVFNDLKYKLINVFPEYISRVKQVQPNDNITMIVYPSDKSISRWSGSTSRNSQYKNEKFETQAFLLTVKRSEILSDSPERVVKYIPVSGSDEYITSNTREDIRIMKAILERAIEDDFKTSLNSNNIHGTYLKDYGILFSIKASGNFVTSGPRVTLIADAKLISEVTPSGEKQIQIAIDRPDRFFDEMEKLKVMAEQKKSIEDRTNDLIDRVTEILGNYGGTIAGLRPEDRINVSFVSRGYRWNLVDGINVHVILVYRDIKAFQRGSISFDELKRKAIIKRFTNSAS